MQKAHKNRRNDSSYSDKLNITIKLFATGKNFNTKILYLPFKSLNAPLIKY